MVKLYASQVIKNNIELLLNFKKNINTASDVQKTKNRILTDIDLCTKMTTELLNIIHPNMYNQNKIEDIRRFADFLNECSNSIMNLNETNITSAKDIIDRIHDYKAQSNSNSIIQEINSLEMYDLVTYVRQSIYNEYCEETEELSYDDAQAILKNININRPCNILSTKTGKGKGLLHLSNINNNITTYGIELRDSCYEEAKSALNRVVKGELKGSMISNNCFDMMHVCPNISWQSEKGTTGNLIEKKEKTTLRNVIKYLRQDGILIFTLPKTRLTKDMAFMLAKALKDVDILQSSSNKNFVHVIGVKDIQKEPRQDVYAQILYTTDFERELLMQYNLPSGGIKEPELFRGSMLDYNELENLINNSGLMESFLEKQSIDNNKTEIRPLLPFNMGQIGLVLTSGCLDGVVEEYTGQYHAIKGMVTKVRDFNDSSEDDSQTSIETISNKVQINLLTPDGNFIELA